MSHPSVGEGCVEVTHLHARSEGCSKSLQCKELRDFGVGMVLILGWLDGLSVCAATS